MHFIPLKRSGEMKSLTVIFDYATASKPFSCLSILPFSSFCASASAIMPKPRMESSRYNLQFKKFNKDSRRYNLRESDSLFRALRKAMLIRFQRICPFVPGACKEPRSSYSCDIHKKKGTGIMFTFHAQALQKEKLYKRTYKV